MSVERTSPSSRQRRRIALGGLVATAALLVGPTAALAQDINPSSDQYDNTPEQIEKSVGGGAGDPGGDPGTGSSDRVVAGLPFTGLDLGLLAAAALLLGASGIVLRRLAGSGVRH
jgi:hypothetical protein